MNYAGPRTNRTIELHHQLRLSLSFDVELFLKRVARMSSAISQVMPLELLGEGERAVVVEIDGNSNLVTRLEEMGLHPGVSITMVRPGSPCILEVNRHRYSFRIDDLVTVLVKVVP
jgi:ferrous iron transport protein A